MEKILSDFFDSVKYYFRVIYLYCKSGEDVYFLLFEEKTENPVAKKYLVLLLSFLIFYLIGIMPGRGFNADIAMVAKSYGLFLSNLESESTFKEHFKFLFSLCVILELVNVVIARKQNRPYLSKYLFFLVSTWFVFFAVNIGIAFIVKLLFSWIGLKRTIWENVVVALTLLITVAFLHKAYRRLGAYIEAEERGIVTDWFFIQVLASNIIVPFILYFLCRGILAPAPVKNDVFMLNGNKKLCNVLFRQEDSNKYLIKTSFIAINESTENYIYDPKGKSFFLYFFSNDKDSLLRQLKDTIFLLNRDTTIVNLVPKMPQKFDLEALIPKRLFDKLLFLQALNDHSINIK